MAENFIESRETTPIRGLIGSLIGRLEDMSGTIYEANTLQLSTVRPGLDITQLPEYLESICALAKLREAAAKKYHEQNNLPL